MTEIFRAAPFDLLAFGARLRDARRQAGLTLKQLSVRSGYSVTHLSQVERGYACPTIGALGWIAGAMGRHVKELLEPVPLPAVSVVRASACRPSSGKYTPCTQPLTHGIPGGLLTVFHLQMQGEPAAEMQELRPAEGPRAIYVLAGHVLVVHGAETLNAGPGEAVHLAPGVAAEVRLVGKSAGILVVVLGAVD